LNPYTGATPPLGTGCAPTPGAPNDCGVVPTLRETWGRLKAQYH
jgi:hypothetical protein